MIVTVSGWTRQISLRMVKPSMSSRRRSVSTRSNGISRICRSASAPLIVTETEYPSISRIAPIVTATLSSSSTTSSLPFGMLRWPAYRECHAKYGAPTFAAAQLDRSAVGLDDALGDPQPQARAFFVFGREEGLEDVRQVLFGDALARIPNLDVDRVRHQELGIGAVRHARRDKDRAAFGHRLHAVEHQVQQHLAQLVGRGNHQRQLSIEVILDLHPVLLEMLFYQRLGL